MNPVDAELAAELALAREREQQLRAHHDAMLSGLRGLVAATNPEEVYAAVLQACRRALPADRGMVFRLPEADTPPELLWADGGPLTLKSCPALCRAIAGATVPIFDVVAAGLLEETPRIRSALLFPSEGLLLVLVAEQRGVFTPQESAIARQLAPLVADAVRRARTLDLSRTRDQRLLRGAAALMQESRDPMWVMDDQMRLATFNDAFVELMASAFHIGVEIGDSVDLLPEPTRSEHRALYTQVLEKSNTRVEWTAPHTEHVFDVSLHRVELSGQALGVAVSAREITRQKEASQRLDRARRAAEEANAAKSLFVAEISHELRTPLNAIIGLTDLLEDEPLPDSAADLLRRVRSNSSSLLHLVSDILDFSKIESGRLDLQNAPTDVAGAVREVFEFLEVRARARHLTYTLHVAPDFPPRLQADVARIRQITTNLIANALKYTPRGRVDVTLRFRSDGEEGGTCVLEVKDTGVGIPQRDHQRVFTQFYRAHRSAIGRTAGTGLGLSITRSLVEVMGGDIALDSAPGQGSTFTVHLPLTIDRSAPATAEPGDDSVRLRRRIRILVADDNPHNLAVTRAVFLRNGDDVVEVADGGQAVERFFEHDFDVVLMDVDMPRVDGISATVQIRAREGELGRPRVPILALTAHATLQVRRHCSESGMDDFLPKPIEPAALLAAVDRHVDRSPHILVVDDAEDSRFLLHRMLEAAGARVVSAEGAVEGLALAGQYAVDAAVLDQHLGDEDGITLIHRLRQQGIRCPAVGCTGDLDSREAWLDAGACAVVDKPVDRAILLEVLARALGAPDARPSIQHRGPREIDPDLADLVPMYLEDRRADVNELRSAMAAGDLETVKRTGHRIKGTGTSYGYPELTAMGGEMERAAGEGDALRCAELIDAIAEVVQAPE